MSDDTIVAMTAEGQSSSAPRILIASASVGAGHNQAARAVAEGLRAAMPAAEVDVLDVLTMAPWSFRAYYSGGYALSVSHFPRSYGFFFRLNDRPHHPARSLMERFRLWRERLHLGRFVRRVQQARPDLIVHTHLLGPPLLGRLIAAGRLDVPQMVVVTDIYVHRYWYAEGVDRWFAPAECSARTLRRWGIEPERITVSGIPIQAKWTEPLDRERVLADWRLPTDRPVVLLTGGTEFTCGPVAKIARRIAARCPGALVAVLAGRNKKLLGRLARLPQAGRDVIGVPFTDRVHELVGVCTLMVTKAGGITTAECLAKGAPMVLLKPVPGQEAGNAAWLAEQGAAIVTRNTRDAVDAVRRLLGEPGELTRMAARARELYRPATETIVRAVREAVSPDGPATASGR